MTKMSSTARILAAASAMFAAACSEDDPIYWNGVAGGGAGGSAGAGGSGASGEGGSVAEAGAAGVMEAGAPDAPASAPARFQAVLEGDRVTVTALDPVWIILCNDNLRVVQQVNDSWTLLRDDRPPASNLHHAAHYVDGEYHSDCRLSLGCDVGSCTPFSDIGPELQWYRPRMIAREFVQVGELDAPTCDLVDAGSGSDAAGDAGTRSVPNIESREPSGPLGIRIQYYRDACDSDPITTDVPVE